MNKPTKVGLPADIFFSSGGMTANGRSGEGKTSLVAVAVSLFKDTEKKKYKIIGIDTVKNECRDIVPNALYFDETNFFFNPFCPPLNVPLKEHLFSIVEAVSSSGKLWASGGEREFLGILYSLYEQHGSYMGSNRFPTILDFCERTLAILSTLEKKKADYSTRSKVSSIYRNLMEMHVSFPNLFGVSRGLTIEKLAQRNCVFNFNGFSNLTKKLLITFISSSLMLYKKHNTHLRNLHHIVIIDEAQNIVPDIRGMDEVPKYYETYLQCRYLKICHILCCQNISKVSPFVAGNCSVQVYFHPASADDLRYITNMLVLSREQQEHLVSMAKQHALLFAPDLHPRPIPIKVKDVEIKPANMPEMRARTKRFLESIKIEPREEVERAFSEKGFDEKPQNMKSGDPRQRLLQSMAESPAYTTLQHYERVGLSRSKGDRHKNEIMDLKWAKPHQIAKGGRGKSAIYWEVIEEGLSQLGPEKKANTLPGKGGFKHKMWQLWVYRFVTKEQGFKARIECDRNGKSADIVIFHPDGNYSIEIELSLKWAMQNITKDHEAGFEKVISLYQTEIEMDQGKKQFERIADEKMKQKVVFDLLRNWIGNQ